MTDLKAKYGKAMNLSMEEKKKIEEFENNLQDVDKKILDEVARRLGEYGISGTDLDLVAKTVGIGKGTIYRHLGNKDKVIEKSIEWTILPIKRSVLHIMLDNEITTGSIVKLMETYIKGIWERRFFFRSLMESAAGEMSVANRKSFRMKHIQRFKMFLPAILKLQIDGKITRDLSAEHLSFVLVGMLDTTVMYWIKSANKKRFPRQEFEKLCKMVYRMLGIEEVNYE